MKNITIDGVEYTPVIKEENKRLIKLLHFEVYPNSIGTMSWDDAKKGCEALGEGWRLPTRVELLLMFETQICNFYAMCYWSSMEEDNNNAWVHNFDNGYQYYNHKGNANYFHPVRDIKQSLTSGTTASTAVLNTLNSTNNTTTQDKNVLNTYTNL